MSVTDKKANNQAKFARECIRLAIGTTATGQTAKVPDSVTPGFAFEVVAVEANALTVTATISFDVLIGSTSCLASAITPVAATPTAGTLSTTRASRQGTSTSILKAAYTSNGTGAATNGFIAVWIRPLGMNGDATS